MKRRLLIVTVSFLLVINVFGQQVPNGNMETWDSTDVFIRPANWLTNGNYVTVFCTPPVITALQTNDKNSGNLAVELRAMYCIDDLFRDQVFIGFTAIGDVISFPNLPYGIAYNQRPAEMNFYYKFHRVGSDVGFATITLITIDNTGQLVHYIGGGSVDIVNENSTYSLMSIPIIYDRPDTPDVMQITFGTSKTLMLQNQLNHTLPTPDANIGTSLWIDDISVSGGTLGVNEYQEINSCKIFPNPAKEDIIIEMMQKNQLNGMTCEIINIEGQKIKTIELKTQKTTIDIKDLSSGLYILKIKSDNVITIRKLIKE